MNALMFAHQILEMEDELVALRIENARLRKIEAEYHEHIQSELRHHEIMLANTLDALLARATK